MQVDDEGFMKVNIGGDIVRRRADVTVCARDLLGAPLATHARPELFKGEILCEAFGDMPRIIPGAM